MSVTSTKREGVRVNVHATQASARVSDRSDRSGLNVAIVQSRPAHILAGAGAVPVGSGTAS